MAVSNPPSEPLRPAVAPVSVAADPEIPDLLSTDPSKRSLVLRILLATGGTAAFVVGMVAWVMPVVPGVPLVILGLTMLGMCNRRMAILINAAERRLPRNIRLLFRPTLREQLKKTASPFPMVLNENVLKQMAEFSVKGEANGSADKPV